MIQPNPVDLGLPDFLKPAPVVPDWIDPTKSQKALSHINPTLPRHDCPSEVVRMQYPVLFETILDRLRGGMPLRAAIEEDRRNINAGDFTHWIMSHDDRKKSYYDALEIGTELMSSDNITIADAIGTPEDVQRSKIRIETRQKHMAVVNRKRFGEVKQIEANVVHEEKITFSISRPFAADAADQAIDAEFTEAITDGA